MGVIVMSEEKLVEIETKIDRIAATLEKLVDTQPPRTEFTVTELSKIKGYTNQTLIRMIRAQHIPFTWHGRQMILTKENADRIAAKHETKNKMAAESLAAKIKH